MTDIEKITGQLLADALQLLEGEGFVPKPRPAEVPAALWLEGLATHAWLLVDERGDAASPRLQAAYRALDSLAVLHAVLRCDEPAGTAALVKAGVAIGEASSFMAFATLGAFESIDDAAHIKLKQRMAGRNRTAAASEERRRILEIGRKLLAGEPSIPRGTHARLDFRDKFLVALAREGVSRSEETVEDYAKELIAEANRSGLQLPTAHAPRATPRQTSARSKE